MEVGSQQNVHLADTFSGSGLNDMSGSKMFCIHTHTYVCVCVLCLQDGISGMKLIVSSFEASSSDSFSGIQDFIFFEEIGETFMWA